MEFDQVKFAILNITTIVVVALIAAYIAPTVFEKFGQLVIGIAIGAIAGLAGNELKNKQGD